ncbi:MAG: outer membrane protein assembly factor [Cyclobacteriaceae bacterium]|nr:BamA/TamA family outer membrane protein [Cyclobacteriaceae bacterium]MCH8516555.1 outer membrane protein assembly factor [Cyclobacteriaceae bacterium]
MKKALLLAITLFCIQIAVAQEDVFNPPTAKERDLREQNRYRLQIADTITTPFNIDSRKRLSEDDILTKKEGFFVTGFPDVEVDPIRGLGIGGRAFFYQNRDAQDPFFYYTPYRYRLSTDFKYFTNGRLQGGFNLDVPYIFNSPWRLRVDALYEFDPNFQYFGIGEQSKRSLEEMNSARTGQPSPSFNTIDSYLDNLSRASVRNGGFATNTHYNEIEIEEMLYNLLGERVWYGGRLRFMFGYEMLFTRTNDWSGRIAEEAFLSDGTRVEALNEQTLINKDAIARTGDGSTDGSKWDRFNIGGVNEIGNTDWFFTSMLAGALIWDTRDLEPDPSEGVFLQYSHEYSAPWLGSQFDFNKFMVQGQYFNTVARWRGGKSRLTLAGMASIGYVWGSSINWLEMFDLSSQAEAGGINVLGGDRSLRAFRESRFVAPAIGLINLEARFRLYDFNMLNQHFALGLQPFYDMGRGWDDLSRVGFDGWRGAPGIGGRIAWNQSTVVRLDFASGAEGSQFFFGFGHIF